MPRFKRNLIAILALILMVTTLLCSVIFKDRLIYEETVYSSDRGFIIMREYDTTGLTQEQIEDLLGHEFSYSDSY